MLVQNVIFWSTFTLAWLVVGAIGMFVVIWLDKRSENKPVLRGHIVVAILLSPLGLLAWLFVVFEFCVYMFEARRFRPSRLRRWWNKPL